MEEEVAVNKQEPAEKRECLTGRGRSAARAEWSSEWWIVEAEAGIRRRCKRSKINSTSYLPPREEEKSF